MRFARGFAVSPKGEASSIRQGDGQRFQKKAMKTTHFTLEASAPANVRPSSVSNTSNSEQPQIDFRQRFQNRALSTAQVLDMLHQQEPRFWELAEVVGQWVWIQFEEKQPPQITAALSQLGFHWNRKRQTWQHPCGHFTTGSRRDPRDKYQTYFPAYAKAA
jgi:hypothetical protein